MASITYHEAVKKATPFMQGLYRAIRMKGFDEATAKEILEVALKCGMVNEAFGEGVDKDIYHIKE